jgi:hypothetical protein
MVTLPVAVRTIPPPTSSELVNATGVFIVLITTALAFAQAKIADASSAFRMYRIKFSRFRLAPARKQSPFPSRQAIDLPHLCSGHLKEARFECKVA